MVQKHVFFALATSCAITTAALAVVIAQDGPPPARRRPTGPPPASGPPPATTSTINYLVPNSSVVAAAADIDTVPASGRYYIRYISLYNIDRANRKKLIQEMSYCINAISRAKIMVSPVVVPHTDFSLIRIDLRDYQFYDEYKKKTFGWSRDVYERLADLEPYFHTDLVKTVTKVYSSRAPVKKYVRTGHYYPNGQPEYRVKTVYDYRQRVEQRDVRVRSSATWVNAMLIGKLERELQTKVPIVRADWLLPTISLPPFYYDLLDVGKSQDDFFDLVFADRKQIRRAQLDIKGVVVKSGAGTPGIIPVTRNNRVIVRFQSLLGYIYFTLDTKSSVDDRDYMRILDNEKFDATEIIATNRNGLQIYYLAKGNAADNPKERQDEAPIEIAVDNTNVDRRVRNGRSCITCHTDGLRPFRPLPQELVKRNISDVVSTDPKRARYLRDTYVSNVQEFLAADTKIFQRAVKASTTVIDPITKKVLIEGVDIDVNAAQYGRFFNTYVEDFVSPQTAAYDTGIPVKDLLLVLSLAKNDPHLRGLSTNTQLLWMRRDHWEKSFQQAMSLGLEHGRVR